MAAAVRIRYIFGILSRKGMFTFLQTKSIHLQESERLQVSLMNLDELLEKTRMVKKSPRSTSTASYIETGFARLAKKFVEEVKRMIWTDHHQEKMEVEETAMELEGEAALLILLVMKRALIAEQMEKRTLVAVIDKLRGPVNLAEMFLKCLLQRREVEVDQDQEDDSNQSLSQPLTLKRSVLGFHVAVEEVEEVEGDQKVEMGQALAGDQEGQALHLEVQLLNVHLK
jgi:hypothetical protein